MIRSIEIENLRGIQNGKLDDLTPLTVLVGPNGCGKSTILEALLIGASPVTAEAFDYLIRERPDLKQRGRWVLYKTGLVGPALIRIITDDYHKREVKIEPTDLGQELHASVLVSKEARSDEDIYDDVDYEYREVASHRDKGGTGSSRASNPLSGVEDIKIVEFDNGAVQTPLHELFTRSVALGRRKEAREILSEILPGATNVEILTEDDNTPTLFVVYESHAVPIAVAGDGIRSLVRLGLELASRPSGVVLLEEPEVHQHPRALSQSARAIIAAARRNIQVILTTHSLELIDSLLAEVQTDEELAKFSVYRLLLQDGCLKSHRIVGRDIAFRRVEIEDDLR